MKQKPKAVSIFEINVRTPPLTAFACGGTLTHKKLRANRPNERVSTKIPVFAPRVAITTPPAAYAVKRKP
jgi:hypothetical protein